MANQETKPNRYAVLTGIRQVEEGGQGRSLSIVACIEKAGWPDAAEINRIFYVPTDLITHGPKASIACRCCDEEHGLWGFLDAVQAGLVPIDPNGELDFSIGMDRILWNALKWLRPQQRPTGNVRNFKRRGSRNVESRKEASNG
jgi:hypothetical protein